ncbi:MAG: transcription-repair coupling factor [Spirochaetes bacterium]|nr:transcription-repair coupling factor [Spirochaetota bacterium]
MVLNTLSAIFEQSELGPLFSKNKKNAHHSIEGITAAAFPLIISSFFQHASGQILVITKNLQAMQEIFQDLSSFIGPDQIFTLPPWGTLPYEFVSPSEAVERERVNAIYKILEGASGVFVTTVEGLIRAVPEKEFILKKGIQISKGEEYLFEDILELLVSYGYTREYKVESFGQFSQKGSIIDIYLSSYQNPVRLDFFGDMLDSVREFDADTQLSLNELDSVTIYPRKELILYKSEREELFKKLSEVRKSKQEIPERLLEYLQTDDHIAEISGIEDIFHLIIKTDTIFSYFNKDSRIFFVESFELSAERDTLTTVYRELYDRKSKNTVSLEPAVILKPGAFDIVRSNAVELKVFTTSQDSLRFDLKGIPGFHGKIKNVREEISNRIENGWKIIICTQFEGQVRRLFDLFSEFNPDSNFEALNFSSDLNIVITPLSNGFEIESLKILVLTDHDIFGKKYRKKKQFKKKYSKPISTFLELKPGDYVVHLNHGIGIFRKIERMSAGGVERDFIIIDYADDDKLYVSLDQITMVQRYVGFDGRSPRIDSLGKKSAWNRIKEKVQESVEEIARDLIEIYSKRQALRGFQFPPDTLWQEEFESKFEYEETQDQITAIEDVKDDMEAPQPMERLICGDVGYGKTEVAIRAAFKAVMAGKQVAILVPTTVLAMQHFSTFRKRFADYPINIEMMSRFRSRTQIKLIKERLKLGEIDIIIGTHALLASDISIKNLGLLVIDEEQRFGVRHKEKLKKLRLLIDVLTLSATPIPRTLHMALAGIRELSIINTPPENRQAIETYVIEENPDITRMAILNEIERGGQVFFVHNRVQTIEAVAEALRDLLPEATFCVAHGQMEEHELEDIIIEFINGRYDCLVATSIIESGLDMPNVNTIIINRAETFGLSQLYQLKGRVGRSGTQAYAYLFYPKHIALTEVQQKRLQVISEYSGIGSGFKIAMKDLEIRGSGNILGKEQSGNIMEVGFDLYCQMLEDAVRKLKGEKPLSIFRTPVFLKTNFYIPEEYIYDEKQKIEFYKRFEACEVIEEVEELEKELVDRFGYPPDEVKILIELEKVRALASSLEIEEIIEDSKTIKIKMSENTKIDPALIVTLMEKDKRLSLDFKEQDILIFKPDSSSEEKRLEELKKWLQQISIGNNNDSVSESKMNKYPTK